MSKQTGSRATIPFLPQKAFNIALCACFNKAMLSSSDKSATVANFELITPVVGIVHTHAEAGEQKSENIFST